MERKQKNSFTITGGRELSGTIRVQGSKNAATKLIAATVLTRQECVLENVPQIADVDAMLNILRAMGGNIRREGGTVYIENNTLDPSKFPVQKARQLRSSVVFAGPLLARFGEITLPHPGGDKIGVRPLDTHVHAFADLGCDVEYGKDSFTLRAPRNGSYPKKIILDEFSVTATENVLMYLAAQPAEVAVSMIAEEPHIQNLVQFLRGMGAGISLLPSHMTQIRGSSRLTGARKKVVPDYIEAGTFVIAALACGGDIRIEDFPTEHLELFLHRLRRAGAGITFEDIRTVRVHGTTRTALGEVQTMIYPGIPTDLQAPLGTLATQTHGVTLIHDPLYEGRLEYLKELKKMGAKVKILDPHRAEIKGPVRLRGVKIHGKDIRGGMSLIIAGLCAKGETTLENVYQVDRGYEKIEDRLKAIGANIERLA